LNKAGQIELDNRLHGAGICDFGGFFEVASGQSVRYSLIRIAIPKQPGAGFGVKLRELLRVGALEMDSQRFGEERMVAIPLLMVVESDDEQVGALDLGEKVLTVSAAQERIAERGRKLSQNGGL
jgi:hypothetical protein